MQLMPSLFVLSVRVFREKQTKFSLEPICLVLHGATCIHVYKYISTVFMIFVFNNIIKTNLFLLIIEFLTSIRF